ncbi:MAG: DUF3387 domain-containing protein [Kiritimatiellae bacterium]|nr:DUF3387 domain-containing protein [Kiritimatiellia bacterium]
MRFFSVGTSDRLSIILQAEEFILSREQGKDRFVKESTALSKLFALAVPHEDALALTNEIAFFQSVRARLLKFEGEGDNGDKKNYESTIRQIVNQAVESTEVVDIFDAAGIKKPDISLLSEEFLQDVKEMKHKNLGIELLKKILNDEIKVRLKFNITEGKNLLDMLEASSILPTEEFSRHRLENPTQSLDPGFFRRLIVLAFGLIAGFFNHDGRGRIVPALFELARFQGQFGARNVVGIERTFGRVDVFQAQAVGIGQPFPLAGAELEIFVHPVDQIGGVQGRQSFNPARPAHVLQENFRHGLIVAENKRGFRGRGDKTQRAEIIKADVLPGAARPDMQQGVVRAGLAPE